MKLFTDPLRRTLDGATMVSNFTCLGFVKDITKAARVLQALRMGEPCSEDGLFMRVYSPSKPLYDLLGD
jgi:hypothetical protein